MIAAHNKNNKIIIVIVTICDCGCINSIIRLIKPELIAIKFCYKIC